MWPFGRKKRPLEFELITRDIPISTIMRWYLYDVALGEPINLAKLLGLPPISEEGDEYETSDSERRLDQIEYIMPFLDMVSGIGADVITAIQTEEIKKSNDPAMAEEIAREEGQMKAMYKVVGLSALLGAFATAMEIGLIAPGELQRAHPDIATEEDDE